MIARTHPTVSSCVLNEDCVSTGSGEEVLNSVVLNNILKNALRFSSRVSNQEQDSVTEVLSFSINPGMFLVADTQLYKRLCRSVGPLVRWSVGPSVHPFVRPLVREHESKSGKMSVLDT